MVCQNGVDWQPLLFTWSLCLILGSIQGCKAGWEHNNNPDTHKTKTPFHMLGMQYCVLCFSSPIAAGEWLTTDAEVQEADAQPSGLSQDPKLYSVKRRRKKEKIQNSCILTLWHIGFGGSREKVEIGNSCILTLSHMQEIANTVIEKSKIRQAKTYDRGFGGLWVVGYSV